MAMSSGEVSTSRSALLKVRELTVAYGSSAPVLQQVDFEIAPGEISGILGESGSGKSTLALSIMGLLPPNASRGGSICFQDGGDTRVDLLSLNERGWRAIRAVKISLIFQDAGISLSPFRRVGSQIVDVIRAHQRERESRKGQQEKAKQLLNELLLHDVNRIYNAYPHQLSGGELHRVVIARALAGSPQLLIADEPTRNLDSNVQAEVIHLLRDVNRRLGCALMFITHNPALLAGFADRVAVVYGGNIVEQGSLLQVYRQPQHPYTKAILRLVPQSLNGHCQLAGEIPGRQVSCFNHGN